MREPWIAYVVVGIVVALMLLGKKMIYTGDENKEKKDKND